MSLTYDELLSNAAFKCNLRHYILVTTHDSSVAEFRRERLRRLTEEKNQHAKHLADENRAMRERLLRCRTPGTKADLVAGGKALSPATAGPLSCFTSPYLLSAEVEHPEGDILSVVTEVPQHST